ncbi:MAG: VanZ family protein [Paludibacteraceae bacterium]|nr:VanZ family protein [Paludibacteraceae bacterium]
MRQIGQKIWNWKETIAVVVVIFYMSIVRVPSDVQQFFFSHFDKFVHFVCYLVLSFVFMYNFGRVTSKTIFISLFFSIIYGGIIELIQQYFLLLRTGDLYDFLSDIIGAIIGVIIFLLIEKVFIKKHTNKN